MKDVSHYQCNTCDYNRVLKRGDDCWGCRTGKPKSIRHETSIKKLLDAHSKEALRYYTTHNEAHPCAGDIDMDAIRPDFVWELPEKVIVLEVDEYEHRHYNIDCERSRVHKLHELMEKPLILLRYNPDAKNENRPESGDKNYSWLMKLMLSLLENKLETEKVVQRGNEVITVLYAGYTPSRIEELWEVV